MSQDGDCEPPVGKRYDLAAERPSTGEARVSRSPARRPIGLSLLAIAVGAIGVALVLWAAAWSSATDIVPGSGLALMAGLMAPALAGAAGFQIVLAYGVWRLRSWAWPLGVGLTITAIALTVLSAGRGTQGAQTLSLLLEIGTLWYLLSPRVQEAFTPCR